MSDFVEHAPCENFEANVFAKSRCQNCFRAVGAHHQPSNQVPEEHTVEAPHSGATCGPDPGGLWDPVCILAPQCELYVCAGFDEGTEGWQESLVYTQLSSRAQDKHGETSPSTDICTDPGTSATLSGDCEMTRLLDSILGLGKQDMMNYTGQRKEVQIGALQSDRPRWGQTISCGSWGRTESQSFMKEISPRKAESSPGRQSAGDGWGKHQMESGYFSLERRKSDPTWVSSPPRASHGALPMLSDPIRAGRRLTSSVSSLDSDLPGYTRGGGEERHGLVRQEYMVLADLPKPKRISHREAFDQERSSSRTRSPGRAEVERIFGYERRKSETLEAFQALEEGLLDRLDGKTPLLAKEGRLGRRQSSPSLYREGNKRLPQQLEQHDRGRGEALRSVSLAWRSERDWRSRVESMCHVSTDKCLDRERVPLQPSNPEKHTDSNWKSQRDSLHPTNSGKSSDYSWTGRGGHLCFVSPGKQTESNWKSPRETHPLSPVTRTERKGKGAKEPLHPVSAGKHMSERQSLEKKRHPVSLGKCTERDQKGHGKSLRPVSPAGKPERDWSSQAETLRPRSPTRQPERDWRSQAETMSPAGKPKRDWRSQAETLRPRSPTRQPERDWRSQAETMSPARKLERDWRSRAETLRPRSPTRQPERDWRSRAETLPPRSQTQRSENNWKTQEECLCHMNPMQQLERDWRSQGECLYSVSSGHQPETMRKSPVSPSQRSESDWKSHERSLDLSSEKQLENDRGKEETLLHQSQLDRGTPQPLNNASSMGSQDLYLNTNGQRKKVLQKLGRKGALGRGRVMCCLPGLPTRSVP
nr:TRIO and F-actin-binding protein-like [Caretta caretta]